MRRKRKTEKLFSQMGSFDMVIPCFKETYVCTISDKLAEDIQRDNDISDGIKSWFMTNKNEVFDEDMFFECVEEDTKELLSDDDKTRIQKYVQLKNESITLKRISMLTLMKGKHYPSELSSFVHNMYGRGSKEEGEETPGMEDSDDALTFHQWVVCHSMIEPKVLPLDVVKDYLSGNPVDTNWFSPQDFRKLKQIKKDLDTSSPTLTTQDVRNMPVFQEELWNANDIHNQEREVEVWWVEDFLSDNDLVSISGAAFNGPNPEDRPDLKPFSKES